MFDPETGTGVGKIVFERYDVGRVCEFLGLDLERFRAGSDS